MNDNAPDLDTLKGYRKTVAQVVAMYGDRFLPVFDRLDEEVRKMDARKKSLCCSLVSCFKINAADNKIS